LEGRGFQRDPRRARYWCAGVRAAPKRPQLSSRVKGDVSLRTERERGISVFIVVKIVVKQEPRSLASRSPRRLGLRLLGMTIQ